MSDTGKILGRVIDNFANTTLANNTPATRTITVPANRRWWVFGGVALNADNVTRTISTYIINAAAQIICAYLNFGSVSTTAMAPLMSGYSSVQISQGCTYPLKAGDAIVITWAAGGASAGGTAQSAVIAVEVPV